MYHIKITDLSTGEVALEENAHTVVGDLSSEEGSLTFCYCDSSGTALLTAFVCLEKTKEQTLEMLGVSDETFQTVFTQVREMGLLHSEGMTNEK